MGPAIYHPLPPTELESWGRISGNQPTLWELGTLRRMILGYVGAKNRQGSKGGGNKYQAIGDYCDGAEVETCRRTFGGQLERVCATCPN